MYQFSWLTVVRTLTVGLAFCLASTASSASGGLVVLGVETSTPGTYSFTFSQDSGPADAIQHRGIVPLNFKIDLPGFDFGSPTGTMTDGTTTFMAGISGWGDTTGVATSIDPNLINSSNSGPITARANPGIDFELFDITWSFTSSGSFDSPRTNLTGVVQAVPEPSSLTLVGVGVLCTVFRRRKQNAV